MKVAKKSDRKQRVELNTQMNVFRDQTSSNWRGVKAKLDKVLAGIDEETLKTKSHRNK